MGNVHFLGPILLVAFAAFILGQSSSPNHSSGSPSQRDNSHGLTQQGKGHGAKEAPGQQIKNKDNSMPTIKKGTTKSQKKGKVRHAKNNGGIGTLGKSKRQKRFLTEIFGNSLDKSKNNAEESELKREGFGIVPEKVKGKAEKTNERAAEKAGEKNGNGGRQKRFDERILGNSTFEPPVLNLGPNWPPPQYRHISFSDASNKRGQQKDEAEKRNKRSTSQEDEAEKRKKRSISQEAEAEKRKKRSIRQEDEAEKRKKRNIAATGKSGRPRGPILPE
ncbi:hypothetical protein niasHS_005688 [Heterodera schachtii]|uniref:Uncharacterized protein n=1 Tax=Heterodera schachtii TaxID=97005 RepID=A0ABD2JZC6_HETSC